MLVESQRKAGFIIVGPMGAGKDYVCDALCAALEERGAHPAVKAVGDYFYAVVADRHRASLADIRAEKAVYLSELQEVGGSPYFQKNAILALGSWLRMVDPARVPVIVARKREEVEALRLVMPLYTLGVDAPLVERIARVGDRDGVQPTEAQLTAPTEQAAVASLAVADGVLVNDRLAGNLTITIANECVSFKNKRASLLVGPINALSYLEFTAPGIAL